MLDRYKILTVTHKHINLKDIGKYVVQVADPMSLRQTLDALKAEFDLRELLYLSTCNRVLYFFDANQQLDEAFIAHFFKKINPLLDEAEIDALPETVSAIKGMDALEHLFSVAASVDSMVIGERQILGQLRDAFEQCKEWGLTGDNLRLAMDQAVVAAKSIYSNTRIGDKPISIASLSIQKMLRHHVQKEFRVLLIGAGQTNALIAKLLVKQNFTNVTVFNRTLSKAQEVASLFENGQALSLSDLKTYTGGFDVAFVCTGAHEPILTAELYPQLLQGEKGTKILIDLAIPHNIEPEIMQNFDVHYIEIDGLRNLAKENLAFREKEMQHAKKMLNEFLLTFPQTFRQRQLEVAMRQVPEKIKAIKTKAMEEVFHKEVELLDENTRELLERMMSYMEKKCIGIPMKVAKEVMI
jgi:glutamyl-tRNA reductase